jgi:hypothetical protein
LSGERTNAIVFRQATSAPLSRVPDVRTRGAAEPSAGTSHNDVS